MARKAGSWARPHDISGFFLAPSSTDFPLSDKAFRKVKERRQKEVSWVLEMKGGGHRGQTNDVEGTTFPADSALAHKEQ